MRIAIVGGRFKNAARLAEIAVDAGHLVEFHAGDVHGRGAGELRSLVARSDMIVILTEINSHGGMHVAKKAARRLDKPFVVLGKLGAARFRSVLALPISA